MIKFVILSLLVWEPLHFDYNICVVNDVTPWNYAENTIPGDVDLYTFPKYAHTHFQVRLILYKKIIENFNNQKITLDRMTQWSRPNFST